MIPTHRRTAAALLRLFLAILFALTAFSPTPALAQDEAPDPSPSFLIALRVPADTPFEQIPAGLDPFQSAVQAAEIVYRQSAALLDALRALQAAGQIERFESQPETAAMDFQTLGVIAIRVYGSREPFETALHEGTLAPEAAGQVAAVLSEGEPAPECAAAAARAFNERVRIASQISPGHADLDSQPFLGDELSDDQLALEDAAPDAAAAAPVVNIYLPTGGTFSSVHATVPANRSVRLEIIRAGKVIVNELKVSTPAGTVIFSPRYLDCSGDEYSWKIQEGDEIRMSSAGLTTTVQAHEITAWIEPGKKSVTGKTAPGTQVVAEISHLDADRCTEIQQTQSGTAGANGVFSIPLTGVDRTAFGQVFVRDANGNGSFTYARSYQIYLSASGWHSGSARPKQTYGVIHRRGSTILYQQTVTTGTDGYFDFMMGEIPQANDVIEVSQNGVIYSRYTYASVTATLDIANNKLTGKTASNHRLTALFKDRTSCQPEKCLSAAPASDGSFTILPGFDLRPAEAVSIYSYDPSGNVQNHFIKDSSTVYLSANLYDGTIEGNWSQKNVVVLLEIISSSGVVKKYEGLILYTGHIYTYFEGLAPGDTIKVTESQTTNSYSMVVPNVTARLRNGSNVLSGTAPAGKLLASVNFPFYSGSQCRDSAVNGNFSLTYSGAGFPGGTAASIIHYDTQGNYTYVRSPHTFTVNYQKGQNLVDPVNRNQVWGYVETPLAKVSLTHKRGGSVLGTYANIASNTFGWYALNFSAGKYLEEGDLLTVTTSDGSSVQLTVPPLEATLTGSSQVSGRAPASASIIGNLYNYYNLYYPVEQSFRALANSSGSFTGTLEKTFWCNQDDVQYPVSTESGCNRIRLIYSTPQGHNTYWSSPMPAPAPADAYEPDNTNQTAKLYTGPQQRTFHDGADSDRYRINVTSGEGRKTVRLVFSGMEGNTQLVATLVYQDGRQIINVLVKPGSTEFSVYLPAEGNYYLVLTPTSGNYGKCSSRYVFTLYPHAVYLPSLTR